MNVEHNFNFNISRDISTALGEEQIHLRAVQSELVSLEKSIREPATSTMPFSWSWGCLPCPDNRHFQGDAKLRNRVNCGSNNSLQVPTGPLRCFVMITSVMPRSGVSGL